MHKIEVQFSQNLARFAVSLFTGEWIEIEYKLYTGHFATVSLFTGERIENGATHSGRETTGSVSLLQNCICF